MSEKQPKVPVTKTKKEDKLKIDFSEVLKNLDGKALKREDKKNLTLRDVVTNALLSRHEDEKNVPGKDKTLRYHLARRAYGAKEPILLKSEYRTVIKEMIGKAYLPLIVGQAWVMIDPAEKDKD